MQGIENPTNRDIKRTFISNIFMICFTLLGQNLLSVEQMMKKCYKQIFYKEQSEIYNKKTSRRIAVKMSSNNIFSLNMKSLHNTTMRTEHVEESHLWPTLKRLEHTKQSKLGKQSDQQT